MIPRKRKQQTAKIIPFPQPAGRNGKRRTPKATGRAAAFERDFPDLKRHRRKTEYACRPVPGVPISETICSILPNNRLEAFGMLEGECLLMRKVGESDDLEGRMVAAMTPQGFLAGKYELKPDGGFRLIVNHTDYDDFDYSAGEARVIAIVIRHEWDTADGRRVEFEV
jgi:hypothetical protein